MPPSMMPGMICSHFTLGAETPFDERIAAAAGAGFDAIGLLFSAYQAELAGGRSPDDLRRVADDHGVRVAEIEFLFGWVGRGVADVEPAELEGVLFEMADVFGARHLNCGDIGFNGPSRPIDEVAERFAGICDRAAAHDLLVAYEFLPWTETPTAEATLEIVERAGRPNGGLLVDTWHLFRGGGDLDSLAKLPPERVLAIQINDAGPPDGEMWDDTTLRRRLPGDGEFDLVGFLRTLRSMGVDAPIGIEIMSTELDRVPPAERAKMTAQAVRRLLDEAEAEAEAEA
jgi:sugar phosphate isomerase/epimerase